MNTAPNNIPHRRVFEVGSCVAASRSVCPLQPPAPKRNSPGTLGHFGSLSRSGFVRMRVHESPEPSYDTSWARRDRLMDERTCGLSERRTGLYTYLRGHFCIYACVAPKRFFFVGRPLLVCGNVHWVSRYPNSGANSKHSRRALGRDIAVVGKRYTSAELTRTFPWELPSSFRQL